MRQLSWYFVSIPCASRSAHVVSGRTILHVRDGRMDMATCSMMARRIGF
jgi:hypothetical protein